MAHANGSPDTLEKHQHEVRFTSSYHFPYLTSNRYAVLLRVLLSQCEMQPTPPKTFLFGFLV